jgi:putative transposase
MPQEIGLIRRSNRIWQRGHWDRQMRGREHYDDRWEYVRQNPVRAGLLRSPDQWPWQGEIRRLSW